MEKSDEIECIKKGLIQMKSPDDRVKDLDEITGSEQEESGIMKQKLVAQKLGLIGKHNIIRRKC